MAENPNIKEFQKEMKEFFQEERKLTRSEPKTTPSSKSPKDSIKQNYSVPETQYIERRVREISPIVHRLFWISLVLNIGLAHYAWEGFQFYGTPEHAVYKLRKQAQEMTTKEKKKYLKLSKDRGKIIDKN